MANTIDNRVVEMQFNNTQFEKNIQTSINSLDKLKTALNMNKSTESFNEMEKAAKSVDISGLADGVSALENRFSAMGIVGMTVLTRLTNAALDAGKSITSALTGAITTGGWNRAANLENAKFQLEGLGVEWEKIESDINYGVQDTAYSLDSAAKAASQLAASQVQVGDEMKTALRAISGVAAITNSSYDDISSVFTTVAGNGRLMASELNRLSARGMNAAAALGQYLGKSEKQVREMTSKGQIDFQTFAKAMDEAFGEHAKDANKTFDGALSNVKSALGRIGAEVAIPLREELRDVLNALRPIINAFKNDLAPTFEFIKDVMHSVSTEIQRFMNNFSRYNEQTRIIDTLRNAFYGLLILLHPIKQAFKDVFPAKNFYSVDQFIKSLQRMVESFRISEQAAEDLRSTFRGIFSIFDIFGQAVSAVIKAILPAGATIGKASEGVLAFTGSVGDAIYELANWLRETDFFAEKIQKLKDFFSPLTDAIDKMLTGVTDTFRKFARAKEQIDLGTDINEMDRFTRVVSMFQGIGNAVGKVFEYLGNAAEQLMPVFGKVGEYIGRALNEIDKAVSKVFEKGVFNGMFDVLNATIFTTIGTSIVDFIKTAGDNIRKATSLGASITGLIRSIAKTLTIFQETIKSDVLMTIAKAVGILTLSIIGLSMIDSEKLAVTLGVVSACVLELVTAVNILMGTASKATDVVDGATDALEEAFDKGGTWYQKLIGGLKEGVKSIPSIGSAFKELASSIGDLIGTFAKAFFISNTLKSIAVAIGVFSVSLLIISTIPIDQLKISMAVLTGIVAEFVGSLILLSKYTNKLEITMGSVVGFAAGILILAIALKKFETIDEEAIQNGLSTIGLLMLELMVFFKALDTIKNSFAGIGPAIVGISVGMIALAAAMKIVSTIDADKLKGSALALAGVLAVMGLVIHTLAGNSALTMVAAAGALDMFAVGLIGIAGALAVLSLADPERLAEATMSFIKVMALMAVALGGLASVMDFLGPEASVNMIAAAGAMVVMAFAFDLLTPSLLALSAIPFLNLMGGVSAFAAAILVLCAAGIAAEPAALGFIALTAAMVGLGAMVLMFGAGVALAGSGILALVTAVNMAGQALAQFDGAFLETMGTIGAGIATAIVEAMKALDAAVPQLLKTVEDILKAALDLIEHMIPEIADVVHNLVVFICQLLVMELPSITSALLNFVGQLLGQIKDNIGNWLSSLIGIITNALHGIREAIGPFAVELVLFIVDTLNAVSIALYQNEDLLIDAVGNLITVILQILGKSLFKFADWGLQVIGSMVHGLGMAVMNIIGFFSHLAVEIIGDIFGWDEDFREAAHHDIEGLIKGFEEKSKEVIGYIVQLGKDILQGFKDVFGIASPAKVMIDAGYYIDRGLEIGIEDNADRPKDAMREMGEDSLSELDGLADEAYDYGSEIPENYAQGVEDHKIIVDQKVYDTMSIQRKKNIVDDAHDTGEDVAESYGQGVEDTKDVVDRQVLDTLSIDKETLRHYKLTDGAYNTGVEASAAYGEGFESGEPRVEAAAENTGRIVRKKFYDTEETAKQAGIETPIQYANGLWSEAAKPVNAADRTARIVRKKFYLNEDGSVTEAGKDVDTAFANGIDANAQAPANAIDRVTTFARQKVDQAEDYIKDKLSNIDYYNQVIGNQINLGEMVDLTDQFGEFPKIVDDNTDSINRNTESTGKNSKAKKENTKDTEELEKATQALTASLDVAAAEYGKLYEQWGKTEAFEEFRDAMFTTEEGIKEFGEMWDSIGKQVDSALKNIFDAPKDRGWMDKNAILKNMRENLNQVSQWADTMGRLAERGLDQGIYKHLQELGPEGYKYVHAFTEMTDDELAQANAMWIESLELKPAVQNRVAAGFLNTGFMALEGLNAGIEQNLDEVKEAGENIGEALKEGTDEDLGIASPAREMIWRGNMIDDGIVVGMYEGVERIVFAIQVICDRILTEFDVKLTKNSRLAEIGQGFMAQLTTGMLLSTATFDQIVDEMMGSVLKSIQNKAREINQNGSFICKELVVGFRDEMDKQEDEIDSAIDTLVEFAVTHATEDHEEDYISTAQFAVNTIIEELENKKTTIKLFEEALDNLLAFIIDDTLSSEEVYDRFSETGYYWAEGLAEGINAGAELVAEAALALASLMEETTTSKKGTDSHSPSRKARKIGKWWSEGLALGMQDGEQFVYNSSIAMTDGLVKVAEIAQPRVKRAFEKLFKGVDEVSTKKMAKTLATITGKVQVWNIGDTFADAFVPVKKLGEDVANSTSKSVEKIRVAITDTTLSVEQNVKKATKFVKKMNTDLMKLDSAEKLVNNLKKINKFFPDVSKGAPSKVMSFLKSVKKEMKPLREELQGIVKTYHEGVDVTDKYSSAMTDARIGMIRFAGSIFEGTEAGKEYAKAVEEATEAQEKLDEALQNEEADAKEIEKLEAAADEANAKLTTFLGSAVQAVQEYQTNLEEAIASTFTLFEAFDKGEQFDPMKTVGNAMSHYKGWEGWADGLVTAANMFSPGIVQSLVDEGVDSYDKVMSLTASDPRTAALINKYYEMMEEKKKEAAQKAIIAAAQSNSRDAARARAEAMAQLNEGDDAFVEGWYINLGAFDTFLEKYGEGTEEFAHMNENMGKYLGEATAPIADKMQELGGLIDFVNAKAGKGITVSPIEGYSDLLKFADALGIVVDDCESLEDVVTKVVEAMEDVSTEALSNISKPMSLLNGWIESYNSKVGEDLKINTAEGINAMFKFGEKLGITADQCENTVDYITKVANAVGEFRDSMKDSFTISSPFQKFEKDTSISLDQIKYNMNSQLTAVKDFYNNLEKMRQLGFSEDMIQYVASMGYESGSAYAEALAKATKNEAGGISDLYKKMTTIPDEYADKMTSNLMTMYTSVGEALQDTATDAFERLGMRIPKIDPEEVKKAQEEAASAGSSVGSSYSSSMSESAGTYEEGYMLIEGTADGIDDAMPTLIASCIRAASSVGDAFSDSLGSSSTSSSISSALESSAAKSMEYFTYTASSKLTESCVDMASAIAAAAAKSNDNMLVKFNDAVAEINKIIDKIPKEIELTITANTSQADAAVAQLNAAIDDLRWNMDSAGVSMSNGGFGAFGTAERYRQTLQGLTGNQNGSGLTINYTQNNTSPKSLSAVEIYRQTQTSLNRMRNLVANYK